jgi:hypothetical protein
VRGARTRNAENRLFSLCVNPVTGRTPPGQAGVEDRERVILNFGGGWYWRVAVDFVGFMLQVDCKYRWWNLDFAIDGPLDTCDTCLILAKLSWGLVVCGGILA